MILFARVTRLVNETHRTHSGITTPERSTSNLLVLLASFNYLGHYENISWWWWWWWWLWVIVSWTLPHMQTLIAYCNITRRGCIWVQLSLSVSTFYTPFISTCAPAKIAPSDLFLCFCVGVICLLFRCDQKLYIFRYFVAKECEIPYSRNVKLGLVLTLVLSHARTDISPEWQPKPSEYRNIAPLILDKSRERLARRSTSSSTVSPIGNLMLIRG